MTEGQFTQVKRLIWLFPVLFLIHDLEEIWTIEPFIRSHSDIIPIGVSRLQFTFAFIFLWAITCIGCMRTAKEKRFLGMLPLTYFCALVPGVFLANGLGHLLQAVFFRGYVPGVITSLFIILPYAIYSTCYLFKESLLGRSAFAGYLLLGFVIQGPIALTAILLAGKLVS